MSILEEALHSIYADKILDVATGKGDFILLLQEQLGGFGQAIGIDVKPLDIWQDAKFDPHHIQFQVMDGAKLNFDAASFDLVAISNSLHHLPQPEVVLAEMQRVLKPAGVFIFHEMYADRQSETQLTHTLLHQWWGKIDTASGVFHRSPYSRGELVSLLESTRIDQWSYFDESDVSDDPLDAELLAELDEIIERYLERTQDRALIAEGQQLAKRVKAIGFHSAPQLFAIGRKGVTQ